MSVHQQRREEFTRADIQANAQPQILGSAQNDRTKFGPVAVFDRYIAV